ncbi:MAG: sensor histidine kinase [Actinobacteria bacterium]|nr:MAG: sensor histidine kinase [Actinomycetota bacterium]
MASFASSDRFEKDADPIMKLRSAESGLTGSSTVPPSAKLRGRWLLLARAGWVTVVLPVVMLFVVAQLMRYEQMVTLSNLPEYIDPVTLQTNLAQANLSVGFYAAYHLVMEVGFAAVCLTLAAVIFWRRSDDRMALFVALLLVLLGTTFWNTMQALLAVYPSLSPIIRALNYLGNVSLFTFFYIFPSGRFVPRWTRWLAMSTLTLVALSVLLPDSPINPDNYPLPIFLLFVLGLLLSGVLAQTYRYRRVSGLVERQQTKWVVFGFAAAISGFLAVLFFSGVLFSLPGPGTGTLSELVASTAMTLSMLLIPLSIGVAILRYRLFDIDLIINRTLVYGALTACVVGIYVLVVGYLGALFRTGGNLAISLVATGLVAVLFAPLRDRLQRGVNRLMYGERDDPYRVLSRLGQRLEATLEPHSVLPAVAETVAHALKLPHVAIELKRGDEYETVAEYGRPAGQPLRLSLVYGTETVGRIVLSPRSPGESFTPADRRLLDDLARQAGIAAHAVRLTNELQRSRERLVATREEERRRIRRDLHDGLGPALSSAMLKLGAARRLLPPNSPADDLVVEVREDMRATVSDVRRLVYDLRPPALDQLGLVLAIRDYAEQCALDDAAGIRVTVHASEELPPLPAAVEVAAYNIAREAITNAARHARAHSCRVHLAFEDALERPELRLEISDDGVGLPAERLPGVGLSSMRERAEELGGTCIVESPSGGGTRVLARLPVGKE